MNKLTYVEARDKIWNAYFRGEIKPFSANFCFCGTLEGSGSWINADISNAGYSGDQMFLMEGALYSGLEKIGLKILKIKTRIGNCHYTDNLTDLHINPDYENALFNGMVAALEVLKQIHRDRGEVIPEDEPPLTKRNLLVV